MIARFLIGALVLTVTAGCVPPAGDEEIGIIEEVDPDAGHVVLYRAKSFKVTPDTSIWWKWLRPGVEVKVTYLTEGEEQIATRVAVVHVEEHSDRGH